MRAVIQRVSWAEVEVDGKIVGRCGPGMLVLIAAKRGDSAADAAKLADRIVGMRIFSDDAGKMNLALADATPADQGPNVLAVSNFTLLGDAMASRRPSFLDAAPFEEGRELFDLCVSKMRELGAIVETGEYGAMMSVRLENDGPVTLVIDV